MSDAASNITLQTGAASGAVAAPELTIVIPTYNERQNVPLMVELVGQVLAGVAWEIIFVDDDSPDGTALIANDIGRRDARVRCLRRIGRRGLAGACIEGMLASQAPYLAVMDADLQHDATLLPRMLDYLKRGPEVIVVGSRYVAGGDAGSGFSKQRLAASKISGALAHRFAGVNITDPMSGFFMLRQDVFQRVAPGLSTQGFKILLDILATANASKGGALRVAELPYVFAARHAGESKLDTRTVLDFAGLLIAKATGDALSPRFVNFLFVGLTGVLVHMGMLNLFALAGMGFQPANIAATFMAMTSNFALNNLITYRDQRLTGLAAIKGLAIFYVICGLGALSNNGVAHWLYANQPVWWLAGLSGSVLSAVWNYSISTAFIWGRR